MKYVAELLVIMSLPLCCCPPLFYSSLTHGLDPRRFVPDQRRFWNQVGDAPANYETRRISGDSQEYRRRQILPRYLYDNKQVRPRETDVQIHSQKVSDYRWSDMKAKEDDTQSIRRAPVTGEVIWAKNPSNMRPNMTRKQPRMSSKDDANFAREIANIKLALQKLVEKKNADGDNQLPRQHRGLERDKNVGFKNMRSMQGKGKRERESVGLRALGNGVTSTDVPVVFVKHSLNGKHRSTRKDGLNPPPESKETSICKPHTIYKDYVRDSGHSLHSAYRFSIEVLIGLIVASVSVL